MYSIDTRDMTSNVQSYWFTTCMNHITSEADQLGEVIPRIKVFLARDGDINTRDKNGESLLSKSEKFKLDHVVKYLKTQKNLDLTQNIPSSRKRTDALINDVAVPVLLIVGLGGCIVSTVSSAYVERDILLHSNNVMDR